MKTIYLHIGQHKTGSTSIQHFCYKNKNKLAEFGYNYLGKEKNHHKFCDLLFQRNIEKLSQLQTLLEENYHNNIILSSEKFCIYDNVSKKYLYSFFKEFNVNVIVYIRKQNLLIESIYIQMLKEKKIKVPIQDYISNRKFKRLVYSKFLSDWCSIFGRRNVQVICYDNVKTKLLKNFLAQIGISSKDGASNFSFNLEKNTKPSIIELKNLFATQQIKDFNIYERDDDNSNNILKSNSRAYNLLAQKELEELMKQFEEDNKRVAKKYFGRNILFYG